MSTTRPKRKRKKRKNKKNITQILFIGCLVIIVLAIAWQLIPARGSVSVLNITNKKTALVAKPEISVDLLDPNPYSRPQTKLEKVNGIVIHYVANPGTSAKSNRDYFNGLKDSHATYASSHFVIDKDGTILQAIPTSEVAYASNSRNSDTIAIECCHYDDTGQFTADTYNSLVELTAYLCGKYNLKKDDIIRHYDVTGKLCPIYYVKHEDKWEEFKNDVFDYIEKNGTDQ
ncbi:hypothetical protein lbkm_3981 [Lachnospiraceae bacterium KM106-2]|nr:hypothetical protein lbkm_3981 [Lachnospiraceae bacterium KM106-2]